MTDCFKIENIQTDIYRITEPYFREHANIFLIKGSAFDLLIDAGLGICNIKKFLTGRGFSPKVITTHGHFDHIGGLSHFTPDEILIPQLSAENLHKRNLWALELLKPEDFDAHAAFTATGKSPQDICREFTVRLAEIPPFRGSEISAGSYTLRMIPLPGHTDDSLVLYDAHHRLLFTGDMLYDGAPYTQFSNSDRAVFRQSLEHLKTLDFQTVLPGHNQLLNRAQAMRVIARWQSLL